MLVLYGSSLFIVGLETCLKDYTELEVVRIQPTLPNSAQRLLALRPDVIIFDGGDDQLGTLPGTAQLTRDHPGTLLMELDAANNSLTILSSQQREVTKSEDILEAIRKASFLVNPTSL